MRLLASLLLALLVTQANAQSNPGFVQGQVLNASALNAAFAAKQDYPIPPSTVLAFGAVCNGSTDDAAAINTALLSGNAVISLPTTACRAASTITVPANVSLIGTRFNPGSPPLYSQIVCDLSVTPCVQVLGGVAGAGNASQFLANFTINRAAGSIPGSSQGLLVSGGYNVIIQNINVTRHYDCWTFKAVATGNGISAKVNNMFSSACSHDHVVVNGWPELYVIGGRLGANGSADLSGVDAFVTITGGGAGIGGPNTVNFSGVQFNQGAGDVAHFVKFTNITGGGSSAVVYNFTNNFAENISGDIVSSDAGVSIIDQAIIANSYFNCTCNFWNINAATQLSRFHVHNNVITNGGGSTFDLPSTQHVDLRIVDNYIQSETTVNGANSADLEMRGNTYAGNLTINNTASGSWGYLNLGGSFAGAAVPVNNLSGTPGKISLDFPGRTFSYTPTVTWGGANTGWTCTCTGSYQLIGNRVDAKFSVVITAKGSSTGLFRLGLPLTLPNGTQNDAGLVTSSSNMSGLTSALLVLPQLNNANAIINQQGAAGTASITDGAFTSTSTLLGSVSYFLN